MDSVLYKIIEIERAAQIISEEAERTKKNFLKELEAEKQKYSIKIDKEIQMQVDNFKEQELKDEQSRIEEIEVMKNQQIELLRELFKSNGSKWEKEIFETIIRKK